MLGIARTWTHLRERARNLPALRRALRFGLSRVTLERRLAGTPYRVSFPAGYHLGLTFTSTLEYEPELTRLLGSWLAPGDVAVDVGANLGIYTLLFHRHVGPTGRIVAFEPDPQSVPWLRRNVARNRIENAEVLAVALGAERKAVTLYQDVTTTRTSSLVAEAWQPDAAPRRALEVTMETLDSLLGDAQRVDFIKIDTEGFEYDVLRGATKTLARFRPTLLVEIVPKNRASIGELLARFGYELLDPVSGRPVTHADCPPNVLARARERP